MSRKGTTPVPIIDLFAGPGGLGEGFSTYGKNRFRIALSIEKDPIAHRTLRLRSFFRQFARNAVPEEYYAVLRGELDDEALFRLPGLSTYAKRALEEAWCAELGITPQDRIDSRIGTALMNRDPWVLIGGPPCQAYSLAGRSRNKGVEGYRPEKDHRHFLYREYLHVIAKHSPAVFVMENVKGILSSSVKGERIFERIQDDLRQPHKALGTTGNHRRRHSYRIYSLVESRSSRPDLFGQTMTDPDDYVVKCEKYGAPQARHRVILLGIRDDLGTVDPERLAPVAENLRPTVRDVLGDMPVLRSGLSSDDSPGEWIRALRENTERHWLNGEVVKVAGERVRGCIAGTLRQLKLPVCDRGSEFMLFRTDFANVSDRRLRQVLRDWYLDDRVGGLCNSSTRGHIQEDLSRYLYAACFAKVQGHSPKLCDFPKALLPNHRNADSGHFEDRFRVQIGDHQSTTVTSHISKDGHYYIHYDPHQCRSLTVREAARLQTFPDNYFFCGNRTQQYVQVGNAVPPFIARQIAAIVDGVLQKAGLI